MEGDVRTQQERGARDQHAAAERHLGRDQPAPPVVAAPGDGASSQPRAQVEAGGAQGGGHPASRPATSAAATANPHTTRSSRACSRRGTPAGAKATRMRSSPAAMANPAAAPPARTSVSARSWRAMRPRPAPRAARTASSRPRAAPRASSSPATFAQATSRTSPTAPNRMASWVA